MEKFIINADATLIKNILITDASLKISDENYKTQDAFLQKLAAEKKGFLDTQHVIEYSQISKIVPFEAKNGIQFFFIEKEKKEKAYLVLNTLEEYKEVLQLVTKKTNHLTLQTTVSKPLGSWIKQAAYTLVGMFLTVAVAFMARDIEANKTIEISGSKRGIKRIMVSIAETLGFVYSIIIGSIIVIGLAFWTYKSYKNGAESKSVYQ